MNMKKWAAAICLAAGMAVMSGCGNNISADVEQVSKEERPVTLTLDANVASLNVMTIVPKLSGPIISPPLVKGQSVRTGDLLVRLDSSPYEQSAAAAEAELSAARAAASAPAAPGGTARRAELTAWYEMGALSRVEYEQQMAQAPGASMPSNSAQIAQLQQSVQTAYEMLNNTTIYSPIDGYVTAVSDNPAVAVAGTVLATIQQNSPLVATFAVPEIYVPALEAARKNGTLRVSVIAPSGESQDGELTYLATEKDPSTNACTAKITFANDKDLFVPGEFYHVRLAAPQVAAQITVPQTAVRTKDSGDFVFIVNDKGIADVRPVLTGDEEGGRIIILEGLKEGDVIISNPPDSLEIGMKVNS